MPIETRGGILTGIRRLLRAAALSAAALVLLPAPAAAAADAPASVRLGRSDIAAALGDDGALVLGRAGSPLLVISPTEAAIPDGPAPFRARLAEGVAGGHRGFSRHADDDGDGLVDEDRADGRDNDGDGLVDEDYAAISDAMQVVDIPRGDGRRHVEAYHWGYSHLEGAVFVATDLVDAAGAGLAGGLDLALSSGAWRDSPLDVPTHAGPATPIRLYAAAPAEPDGYWLGVTVFPRGVPSPPVIQGRTLILPHGPAGLDLAVCAAPTLLQLHHAAAVALAVRAGVRADPAAADVPWVVPPLCPVCQRGRIPAARAEVEADGSWRLVFAAQTGDNTLIDPGALVRDGVPLAAPGRIFWKPAPEAPSSARSWDRNWAATNLADPAASAERIDAYLAHGLEFRHMVPGDLGFDFDGGAPAPGATLTLDGSFACGRIFTAVVPVIDADSPAVPADADDGLGGRDGSPPTLAPSLLENFPNPFRDRINVRYRVPDTVGEGFVWGEGQEPALAPGDPIPYAASPPQVTLKVYSVAGHEVATLHSGPRAAGLYEAAWNGSDATGRPVAAGTYFCKLQIENWSVTKRVTLLR